tara:strand:- start:110 stop:295 length:186 start_codon:yes stop_codon:yes gene_type:complete
MKDRLFYFTFFDELTKRAETLEVQAKTFAEASPAAYVYKARLNKRHKKSDWDVITVNSKLT